MTPLNIPGLPNGYNVDDLVWRSGQPEDSAYPLLASAGCKYVIDLDTIDAVEVLRQRSLVESAGMGFTPLRWSGILGPCQSQIDAALTVLDYGHYPVLVHCQHGSDRTGTLCACWRMHHDGWTFERAMDEAFWALGTQGMHEFWMAAAAAEYARRTGVAIG